MVIQTKFSINDTFYMYSDGSILKCRINSIKIERYKNSLNNITEYTIGMVDNEYWQRTMLEEELKEVSFKTKEDCKKNIINQIKKM